MRHFNPLPPELVERILLLTTNKEDIVLDPFAGSGAVLAQAHAMGRRYIGLDLNGNYREMFEKRVLTALCDLYEQKSEEKKMIENAKEAFSRVIRSLRKTKYPKQLVRLYERKYNSMRYNAVLALQGPEDDILDVIFLFPLESEIPANFLPRMIELSRKPPLSKYGIEVILEAYFSDVMSQQWLQNKNLDFDEPIYLYLGGRTYSWAKSISAEEFLQFIKNNSLSGFCKLGYPPIVSNIRVKVNPKSPASSLFGEDR